MPLDRASSAAATAKMETATAAVSRAVQAIKATQAHSSPLLTTLQHQAKNRTLYSYGAVEEYGESKFAPAPLIDMLAAAHRVLGNDSSASRVLYAPPSKGKTTAAKAFLKNVLGDATINCPALMFTGAGIIPNYVQYITNCFEQAEGDPEVALKCLIAALSRSSTATLGNSWLNLDAFNSAGEAGVNMAFADALFRQVAEKKLNFTVLFITQRKEIASDLLAMNCWQKIAPLPQFTVPDATSVTQPEEAPEEDKYNWVPISIGHNADCLWLFSSSFLLSKLTPSILRRMNVGTKSSNI